jgi:lipopolysaccharide export system protein LptC
MWSQFAIATTAAALLAGCGDQTAPGSIVSDRSLPNDAPDLVLYDVAFARLADGRVAARGTAKQLGYRRAGGRLDANIAFATLYPEPSTGYATFGAVQLDAPRVEGDLSSKRGTASGGVNFRAARGDRGSTERILCDGLHDELSGDRDVIASGPGYAVRSHGFSAHADGSDVTLTGGVSGTLQPEASLTAGASANPGHVASATRARKR